MKNKKGKKLVVLGAMAALLTLIGVSGSQTYAKYVESATVNSGSATVAKWGYVVGATENLFGANYGTADVNRLASVTDNTTGLTVDAASATLAPGTKGSMDITIDGSSEVDVEFTFVNESYSDIHLVEKYYPVKWTLDVTGTTEISELTDVSLREVIEGLEGSVLHFDAGQPVNVTITISWKWAYENGLADTGIEHYDALKPNLSSDDADTILAILAKGDSNSSMEFDYTECLDAYHDTIKSSWNTSFDLTVTATQVQDPVVLP